MRLEMILPKYVDSLLEGNRNGAREMVRKAICTGVKAEQIYKELLVPAMTLVQQLYREDKITTLVEHMASRINRFITDQVQAQLMPSEPNGRTAVVVCAETQCEELGGQVCADVLEASGWQTLFLGGGVPEDELVGLVGKMRPELLVVYGSSPSGVPQIRETIIRIRDIGASPTMNVIATGGIFDRVEGLWKEIQADLYASDPVAVAEVAEEAPQRMHLPRDPMAPKRRRKLVGAASALN